MADLTLLLENKTAVDVSVKLSQGRSKSEVADPDWLAGTNVDEVRH